MKSKALKRFYIFILIIIFIMSLILLIENIGFIHKERDSRSTTEVSQGEVSGEVSGESSGGVSGETFGKVSGETFGKVSPIHSDIPILNYASDKIEGVDNNPIIEGLTDMFPINQYVNRTSIASNHSSIRNQGTINDVLGIIDNIRNDRRIPTGKVENIDNSDEISINVIEGGIAELEGDETAKNLDSQEVIGSINGEHFTVEQLLDRPFLYNNFYIIDSSTTTTDNIFDANVLLEKDLTIEKDSSKPQILIYHTHSQETFIDSRPGEEEDTVVGLGVRLATILSDYGFNVIHDKTKYDIMGEGLDRNLAYNYAHDGISKILEENPSIEVIIDVHRDGGQKRLATIDGVDTAQVMLFNGISTNAKGQPIERLPNPNLQGNLAFSLQLQLKSREIYPGFMKKNYLKAMRYNLHFREKSLLVEVGTDNNTIGEAKNAMDYLGATINEVISK